jgi:hypothetical protein
MVGIQATQPYERKVAQGLQGAHWSDDEVNPLVHMEHIWFRWNS